MNLLMHSLLTFLGLICISAESMPQFAKPLNQKQEKKTESKSVNNQRSPSQLNTFLSDWRTDAQSPLHTWWASSWEHPPYQPNLHSRELPEHESHHHQAIYVAANLGAVHIAPLLGHFKSVIAANLGPVVSSPVPIPQVTPVEPQLLPIPSFLVGRNSNSDGTLRTW